MDEKKFCSHCQVYEDAEIKLTDGYCESCQNPKTCDAGDDGGRCEGCARHLYEMAHDL